VVAALAVPARADQVNIAPELACTVSERNGSGCGGDLLAGTFTEDTPRYSVALLRFDLENALPEGAVVNSARLHLHRFGNSPQGASGPTLVGYFDPGVDWTDDADTTTYDGTNTWDLENTYLYGDPGADPQLMTDENHSFFTDDRWISWDTTPLVRGWVNDAEPNHGVLLTEANTVNYAESVFAGSAHTTAALRPFLEVDYFVPCPSDPFAAAQSSAASTVYAWNAVLLDAFRDDGQPTPPTALSRAAAMMHVGIFDTFNSVFFAKLEDLASGDPGASETCGWESYTTLAETPASTNANLAAEIAARDILLELFPNFATEINAAFTGRNGNGPYQGAAQTLGAFVADEILAERSSDGSGSSPSYTLTATPGAWRPSLNTSSEVECDGAEDAVSPGWGNVTPFTLSSGSQFRQPLPGGFSTYASLLASAFYADQFDEVKAKGRRTLSTRTMDEEKAAFFWANDLDGTYKPPGQLLQHTYELAITQPAAQGSGDPEDFFRQWSQQGIRVARLFAEVSLAMADGAIASWDQKYLTAIDLWRPVDAIQLASSDGNNGTQPDANWIPLSQDRFGEQFSPCFPAWVSGHATFGGAWSRVMENEFRQADLTDPFPLELSSEDPEAVERSATVRAFDSFAEAGEENAESRIWLGVHYRIDAEDGLDTGRAVADHVAANRLRAAQKCEDWDCTDPITP
jgi:hypothetical protein